MRKSSRPKPVANHQDLGERLADIHDFLRQNGWPESTRLLLIARNPDVDTEIVMLTDEPTKADVSRVVELALTTWRERA